MMILSTMYNVHPPAHKHQQNTDFRICISCSNITSPCIGDIGDVNVFLGGDVGCLNRKPGGAPPIPNCPCGPHITRAYNPNTTSNTESPASTIGDCPIACWTSFFGNTFMFLITCCGSVFLTVFFIKILNQPTYWFVLPIYLKSKILSSFQVGLNLSQLRFGQSGYNLLLSDIPRQIKIQLGIGCISFRGTDLVGTLERFQTRTIFRVIAKSSKSSPVLDVFDNSSARVDFLKRKTGFLWRTGRISSLRKILWASALLWCSFKLVFTKRPATQFSTRSTLIRNRETRSHLMTGLMGAFLKMHFKLVGEGKGGDLAFCDLFWIGFALNQTFAKGANGGHSRKREPLLAGSIFILAARQHPFPFCTFLWF